jgi:uncharacterized membrane protein
MQFFTEQQQKNIISAIHDAEDLTSGEIKVHVEAVSPYENPMDRAKEVFQLLALHKTGLRNGVLLYLAYEDHKFVVLGDEGINNKVGQGFWDSTIELMKSHFIKGDFEKGFCLAIEEAGKQLKKYFPYNDDHADEITNDISFG